MAQGARLRVRGLALRAQGKSQRRWQMLHALHLVALRDLIRKHSRARRRRMTALAPPSDEDAHQLLSGPLHSFDTV